MRLDAEAARKLLASLRTLPSAPRLPGISPLGQEFIEILRSPTRERPEGHEGLWISGCLAWNGGDPIYNLDAITDLIEHVLPECSWGVSVEPVTQVNLPFDVTYHAYVGDHWPPRGAERAKWWGEASYREGKAMALCEAFLLALISKAEAGDAS